ncbi:MAG: hypothetical protein ACYC0X_02035 [Pirellulaceae bacterium]
MSSRRTTLIYLLLPLLAAGCHMRPYWLRSGQSELPPAAFVDQPTLEDVVYVVNANTQRVQRLQTENATLRVEGVPALRANLAYEQPRNFRLLAQLSQFTGRELDMGSNDELFWFWIRRDSQPSVYYARHAHFAASPARDLIPIEPNRLIDTLGLVYLDPAGQHRGPIERDAGLLEITSQLPSPRGDLTRVLLIDAKYGWPAQQHLYDANGQLLMSARASRQRFYRDEAVTMPHRVEVTLMPGQPAQIAFDVDVASYAINRLSGDAAELWTMPQIEGYPSVDIADPQFRLPVAAIPLPATSTTIPYGVPGGYSIGPPAPGARRIASLPSLRGYERPLH